MYETPVNSFSELTLSPNLQRAITELGYTTPSPIQAQALPILLGEATDFLGLAATGTGKTAAFGIPMLEKIDTKKREVQAIVLCPTRELAMQVSGQINLLGKFKGVRAVPVYGGASFGDQVYGLKQGAAIVVGTPGRVIDHIDRGTLKLGSVQTVILDEADEMISMGFKDELEKILEAVPRDESNIWLFSATMSREVRRVADNYLRKPKQVQVNNKEMLSTNVEQIYYITHESNKPEILCKLIDDAEDFYGIIFCQTKALVSDLSMYLMERGYKVDSLHGDKDQRSREKTMQAFRDHQLQMIVCTDVAARGLDVKDVTHVVNYSIPRELDSYVHRIGRTARSGKSGVALSLVTPANRRLIERIEFMTKSRMKQGIIPSSKDIGIKKVTSLLPRFGEQKNFARAAELMDETWMQVIKDMEPKEIVARFIGMLLPEVLAMPEKTNFTPQFDRGEDSSRRHHSGSGRRGDSRGHASGGGGGRPKYRGGGGGGNRQSSGPSRDHGSGGSDSRRRDSRDRGGADSRGGSSGQRGQWVPKKSSDTKNRFD